MSIIAKPNPLSRGHDALAHGNTSVVATEITDYEDMLVVMQSLPRLYRSVLEMLNRGQNSKVIARIMGMHESTAERYSLEARSLLYDKLIEYRREKPAIEARKKLRAEREEFAALADLLQVTAVTVLLRAGGPLVCRCESGHHWQGTIAELKEQSACPTCLTSRKLTRSHCVALGRTKKLRFEGAVPQTRHKKGMWVCGRGHINYGSWFAVTDWKGCPICNDAAPKTGSDYRKLAETQGLRWTGLLPPNTDIETDWVCLAKGHPLHDSYQTVQTRKVGCLKCNHRRRKTREDYFEVADHRGLRWMANSCPSTAEDETLWRCIGEEHVFFASYTNVQRALGCPVCNQVLPLIESDYKVLAALLGLTYEGPFPANTREQTHWRCHKKGHALVKSYHDLDDSTGCPTCRKKDAGDYRAVGQERGISWVGQRLPKNVLAPTSWQHSCGYRWSTCYANIDQGRGCPSCAGVRRVTAQDCHDLAASKNCVWLGSKVPNNKTKMPWQCLTVKHVFSVSYTKFKHAKGCPHCNPHNHRTAVPKRSDADGH
jgi:hypothetical protein